MTSTDDGPRSCLWTAVRVLHIGMFSVFLFFLLGTISAGERPTYPLFLGTLFFGTLVSRDVFTARPPAYVEYAVSIALVIGSAAFSGHWALAIAVVAILAVLRLLWWYVHTRSRGGSARIS